MVNLICGPKGSGKTQRLIEHATKELQKTNGLIVFVDSNDKNRISITNEIRFINAKEFMIDNANNFFGFFVGLFRKFTTSIAFI
jgi:thymidine kinase